MPYLLIRKEHIIQTWENSGEEYHAMQELFDRVDDGEEGLVVIFTVGELKPEAYARCPECGDVNEKWNWCACGNPPEEEPGQE